jgi:hypothetical protein
VLLLLCRPTKIAPEDVHELAKCLNRDDGLLEPIYCPSSTLAFAVGVNIALQPGIDTLVRGKCLFASRLLTPSQMRVLAGMCWCRIITRVLRWPLPPHAPLEETQPVSCDLHAFTVTTILSTLQPPPPGPPLESHMKYHHRDFVQPPYPVTSSTWAKADQFEREYSICRHSHSQGGGVAAVNLKRGNARHIPSFLSVAPSGPWR